MSQSEKIDEAMEGKTGSVTLHYKYGKLLKVEYRIIESAAK